MNYLSEFLNFIALNNNYYKNIINSKHIEEVGDINHYPLISRDELQINRLSMFSDGYKEKYYWEQLLRKTSSGSTGIPINVYWDFCDYYSSVKVLWKKRKYYYGIKPNDKYLKFDFININYDNNEKKIPYIYESKNILNINIEYIIENNDINFLFDLIEKFKPKWIYIRPFILSELINLYVKYDRQKPESLIYIESYGEILPKSVQKKARFLFNVPVANMYGSEEHGCIALECPFHKMHILEENIFVECLQDDRIVKEGTGEIIITSLKNKAMPLIRYLQGDEITLEKLKNTCQCGSSEAVISNIKGRSLEKIRINNQIELNPQIFLSIMSEVNNQFNGIIIKYKYIYYKERNHLECYVQLNKRYINWFDSLKQEILYIFDKNLPYFKEKINIIKIDNFSLSNKHKIFEIK